MLSLQRQHAPQRCIDGEHHDVKLQGSLESPEIRSPSRQSQMRSRDQSRQTKDTAARKPDREFTFFQFLCFRLLSPPLPNHGPHTLHRALCKTCAANPYQMLLLVRYKKKGCLKTTELLISLLQQLASIYFEAEVVKKQDSQYIRNQIR